MSLHHQQHMAVAAAAAQAAYRGRGPPQPPPGEPLTLLMPLAKLLVKAPCSLLQNRLTYCIGTDKACPLFLRQSQGCSVEVCG